MAFKNRIGYHILVVYVFLLFSLIYFLPFLTKESDWGYHDWDMILNEWFYWRKTIIEFHQIPLWDPYFCGGLSFISDPFFPHFSPTMLLPTLLNPIAAIKINAVISMVIG